MVDSDGSLKRKSEGKDPGGPIKRLRSSQQAEVSGSVVSTTSPGDDGAPLRDRGGGRPAVIKRKPFALPERDVSDKSKMLQKIGLRGNLAYKAKDAKVPVIAQMHQIRDMLQLNNAALVDKEMEDAILKAYLPSKFAGPPKGKIFLFKENEGGRVIYEELPLETYRKLTVQEAQHLGVLPDWKLTDREMFDLGFLKEEQLSRISREELMARNPDHSQPENRRPATQGRDAGSPIESEPARNVSQPPLAIATVFDWDEFNGEFPEDIHRPEPEGPDRRSNSKTDLYLRNPRDDCLTDAAAAASMHVDLPSDKLVLKKAGPDHLRLTESGVSALGDVSMIVREADGSYGLVRSERIKARSFEEWTAKHGRDGVFLRDGNDFLSVDRYNSTHNTKYKPDAAGGRFAAISGRSSRGDLPQLMIEDDEGDFVEIHDYLSRAGSRSLKERNIIIPSANGKALHSPWVSEKQNRLYFAGLTTDEQVLRLLGCYDRYSHRRKPLPPVLVLVDGKLVNGEKLNVLDHLYAPFVERHPEENLFLQNHENGRLTGNYKILNKYSKPTLEQDQIIGQHPQTEQERRAQIPPIVDPVRPVAEIPPGTDDPYIASKPAGEDAARRRGLDRTQHSRSRSR